ncbi:uncharacterized protein [Linepithema humile]|uniref:uncharacterized protein n=1 Tax=Linepithema humile TaxID=83485 RepID=UPI00351F799D
MMNPPRHACRGRPMVCPGPCNPLKAHHHHHHHRHHRQKPDVTSVAASEEDVFSLPEEFDPILLLKFLKLDTPGTSATSADDTSISRASSLTRITLIKTSSVPKTSQPDETTDAAILRRILSRGKLEMFGEPSTGTGEPTIAPKTILYPKIVKIPAHQIPRTLNGAECIIAEGLNGPTAIRMSSFFLSLTMLAIYAGIHVLLAVITWRTPAYQFFVSSQICGALAFLMWHITGTILI